MVELDRPLVPSNKIDEIADPYRYYAARTIAESRHYAATNSLMGPKRSFIDGHA
jgi:hypothetical protein